MIALMPQTGAEQGVHGVCGQRRCRLSTLSIASDRLCIRCQQLAIWIAPARDGRAIGVGAAADSADHLGTGMRAQPAG
jgi:hypothetical protein